MFTLSLKDSLLLLAALQNEEVLWNTECPDYRNGPKCEASFRNLISVLNIPGFGINDVECKVRDIFTRYTELRQKVIASHGSYTPTWKLYEKADLFLRKIVPGASSDIQDALAVQTDSIINIEDEKQDLIKQSKPEKSLNQDFKPEVRKTEKYMKLNRKRKNEEGCSSEKLSHTPTPSTSYPKETKDNPKGFKLTLEITEDEFDLFGKSVATQLNKMPLREALIVQQKLKHIINNYKRCSLQGTSSNALVTPYDSGNDVDKEIKVELSDSIEEEDPVKIIDFIKVEEEEIGGIPEKMINIENIDYRDTENKVIPEKAIKKEDQFQIIKIYDDEDKEVKCNVPEKIIKELGQCEMTVDDGKSNDLFASPATAKRFSNNNKGATRVLNFKL